MTLWDSMGGWGSYPKQAQLNWKQVTEMGSPRRMSQLLSLALNARQAEGRKQSSQVTMMGKTDTPVAEGQELRSGFDIKSVQKANAVNLCGCWCGPAESLQLRQPDICLSPAAMLAWTVTRYPWNSRHDSCLKDKPGTDLLVVQEKGLGISRVQSGLK